VSIRVTDIERRAFFTPKTLAEYLHISDRQVRNLLKSGKLPSYRVEGSRRIAPEDVDRYLRQRRQEAA
jgi:excisionase family DNA binding protein